MSDETTKIVNLPNQIIAPPWAIGPTIQELADEILRKLIMMQGSFVKIDWLRPQNMNKRPPMHQ